MATQEKVYTSFSDFYPYYLQEHSNVACRRLHFVGSALIVALVIYVVATSNWAYLFAMPVIGYGFAWFGHFFFEKNRPATFTYPFYSLMGDWVMFKDMLIGKIKF